MSDIKMPPLPKPSWPFGCEYTKADMQAYARAAVQANVPDAEAVKDAERYRWLRAALADRSVNGRSHWFCSIPENQPEWLDTEIDVAMLSAIQKG